MLRKELSLSICPAVLPTPKPTPSDPWLARWGRSSIRRPTRSAQAMLAALQSRMAFPGCEGRFNLAESGCHHLIRTVHQTDRWRFHSGDADCTRCPQIRCHGPWVASRWGLGIPAEI
jgi:hypothetical protein